jgi:hypothetical protein
MFIFAIFKAGKQSGYPYPLFREADKQSGCPYLLFSKAGKQSGYPYPLLFFSMFLQRGA